MFNEDLEEIQLLVQKPEKNLWLVYGKVMRTHYIKKIIYKFGNINVYKNLKEKPCKGIPKIYDIQEEDDCIIVIEEYINGKALDIIMQEGRLSDENIHMIFLQLCDIVHHLDFFRPPIIHRDIKPANIVFTQEQIYLIDYDIARSYEQSLTKDTTIIGSVGYAAPEQYGFTQSDRRSDIYAMGVLLNEMLTGEYPNNMLPMDGRKKIIEKCISMDPEDRYQNVMGMKADYEQYLLKSRSSYKVSKSSSYTLPGFRSKNATRMMVAMIGYAFWLYLSFTINTTQPMDSEIDLFFYRISASIMVLLMILVPFNYRGIQNITRLGNSDNIFIRYFNVFLVWLSLSFVVVMLYVILSGIIQSLL